MPKLTGVFGNFEGLDSLTADELNQWLKSKEQSYFIENYLGNKILYPQSIPSTMQDLEIDMAIFREYIRRSPQLVISPKNKKMVIPEEFIVRFPPIQKLISIILDVVTLSTITPISIARFNGMVETVGTVVSIINQNKEGFTDVNVNGQLLKLEVGSVTILPNKEQNIIIQVEKNQPIKVNGGEIGVVIDLRKE